MTQCYLIQEVANSLSDIRKVAGIPNITGYSDRMWGEGSYSGALYRSNQFSVGWVGGNNASVGTRLNIKASNSNSIYGNSSTVTPLSLSCRFIIRH